MPDDDWPDATALYVELGLTTTRLVAQEIRWTMATDRSPNSTGSRLPKNLIGFTRGCQQLARTQAALAAGKGSSGVLWHLLLLHRLTWTLTNIAEDFRPLFAAVADQLFSANGEHALSAHDLVLGRAMAVVRQTEGNVAQARMIDRDEASGWLVQFGGRLFGPAPDGQVVLAYPTPTLTTVDDEIFGSGGDELLIADVINHFGGSWWLAHCDALRSPADFFLEQIVYPEDPWGGVVVVSMPEIGGSTGGLAAVTVREDSVDRCHQLTLGPEWPRLTVSLERELHRGAHLLASGGDDLLPVLRECNAGAPLWPLYGGSRKTDGPEPDNTTDGPEPPDRFRWKGRLLEGDLPDKPFRLLCCLWGQPGRFASLDQVKLDVWRDANELVDWEKVRNHAKVLHKFFDSNGVRLRVSCVNGYVTLRESESDPGPKKIWDGKR